MDENRINIKVTIGGRVYSLRVEMEEEEFVRRAVERIEQKIQELQASYTVSDDKDLLAMAALQIGSELARLEKKGSEGSEEQEKALKRMEARIADYLKESEEAS